MIQKITGFIMTYYLFIGVAAVIIAVLAVVLMIKKNKARKIAEAKDIKTVNLLDRSSLRRPYMRSEAFSSLFDVTKNVVYAQFAQDPTYLSAEDLNYDLYMKIYTDLKRDYDVGIKKTLYSFEMPGSLVVKQTSDSLSVITHVTIESFFKIACSTYHVSFGDKPETFAYKQKFVFISKSGKWLLDSIQAPEAVTDYEWEILEQQK